MYLKHDTTGSTNAQAHTHNPSKTTTIRVKASHKTQLCNNSPLLKYLWASAYNPPISPVLFVSRNYLASGSLLLDTCIQKITGARLIVSYCVLYAATTSLNKSKQKYMEL